MKTTKTKTSTSAAIYLIKNILLVLTFMFLSVFMKAWTALFLIFYILPVLVVWLIILAIAGNKNKELRDKNFNQISVTSLLIGLTAPGFDDAGQASAFTIFKVESGSFWVSISYLITLASLAMSAVFAIKYLIKIAKG